MSIEGLDTREADWDGHFPFVLWDYYMDKVASGELTQEEATNLYLQDMAQGDGGTTA